MSRVMKIQEAEVNRQDGIVREVVGNRLVSVFHGRSAGIIHAIRAARAVNEELASQHDLKNLSIAVGVSTGDFVTGSVELVERERTGRRRPTLRCWHRLFAWHAPSGLRLHLVRRRPRRPGGPTFSSRPTREEVRLKWLAQPLAVASMPAGQPDHWLDALDRRHDDVLHGHDAHRRHPARHGPRRNKRSRTCRPGAPLRHAFTASSRSSAAGGMGIVYKAVDTQLDETVAIKTLSGDVMARLARGSWSVFKREIRLARKITHRNIPSARTTTARRKGVYFISMEVRPAATPWPSCWRSRPTTRWLSRLAVGIGRQICRGLQAAHEQGIIHRDIKPQKRAHRPQGRSEADGLRHRPGWPRPMRGMTQVGLIVGTPHYMSPEQVQGKQLDPRQRRLFDGA